MNPSVEHLISSQNKLGEGPLWSAAEQALYWVDIHQKRLERFEPASGQRTTWTFDQAVTVLGLRAAGGFVFAGERGFGFWNGADGGLALAGHPEAHLPYNRFNDGAVDPAGRFWAGSMYEGPQTNQPVEGRLYRFDPGGSIHLMESGLTICNGMRWSPDRKTLYFTDTLRRAIYAYDFDESSGVISNRRSFVQAGEADGYPDGLTVDSQGFIWSAFWGGWMVRRYDPQGVLERSVALPVECPTSVTFGGKDLTDIYITSAWTALDAGGRAVQPFAGDVFRIQQGIQGLPEYQFLG